MEERRQAKLDRLRAQAPKRCARPCPRTVAARDAADGRKVSGASPEAVGAGAWGAVRERQRGARWHQVGAASWTVLSHRRSRARQHMEHKHARLLPATRPKCPVRTTVCQGAYRPDPASRYTSAVRPPKSMFGQLLRLRDRVFKSLTCSKHLLSCLASPN